MGPRSTLGRLEEGLGLFVGEVIDHRRFTRWERTGATKQLFDGGLEALLVAPRRRIGGHLIEQAIDVPRFGLDPIERALADAANRRFRGRMVS